MKITIQVVLVLALAGAARGDNLRFYLDFMADLRQAIGLGALTDKAEQLATRSTGEDPPGEPDPGSLPVSSDPLEQRSS